MGRQRLANLFLFDIIVAFVAKLELFELSVVQNGQNQQNCQSQLITIHQIVDHVCFK
jgi:hypothetical protein